MSICCVGAELKAAEAARSPGTAKLKPKSNGKGTAAPDSELDEPLLQQWLHFNEDDNATRNLDLEVAELIDELKPKYPEYTWREHVYVLPPNPLSASPT